jgi:hypothetical protein
MRVSSCAWFSRSAAFSARRFSPACFNSRAIALAAHVAHTKMTSVSRKTVTERSVGSAANTSP